MAEPGRNVIYTVTLLNTSAQDLTLDSLVDDRFGDLDDPANARVSVNTCASQSGAVLPPGVEVSCWFLAYVDGEAGDPGRNALLVRASDAEKRAVERSASARVAIVAGAGTGTGEADPGTGADQGPGPLPVGWLILALAGAVLLALGFMALRRDRDEDLDAWG